MAFPETRHSAILGLHDSDAEVRRHSIDILVNAYWQPVCTYLRLRWKQTDEDAGDLTQAFFSKTLESATLLRYDPSRGTFRTYLRTCLDRFALNVLKKFRHNTVPLEIDLASAEESAEEFFHREWVRSIFSLALEDLRTARGREIRFRVFERYDLNDSDSRPTYEQLGAEFGVSAATITNYLAAIRRDFRRAVLNRLQDLTVTDREFRSEARALLGIEV
jgi:RNA polymerase sigma factor (sigma-70 family)